MRAVYNDQNQSIILHGQYCTCIRDKICIAAVRSYRVHVQLPLGERGKQGKLQVTRVVSCLARELTVTNESVHESRQGCFLE